MAPRSARDKPRDAKLYPVPVSVSYTNWATTVKSADGCCTKLYPVPARKSVKPSTADAVFVSLCLYGERGQRGPAGCADALRGSLGAARVDRRTSQLCVRAGAALRARLRRRAVAVEPLARLQGARHAQGPGADRGAAGDQERPSAQAALPGDRQGSRGLPPVADRAGRRGAQTPARVPAAADRARAGPRAGDADPRRLRTGLPGRNLRHADPRSASGSGRGRRRRSRRWLSRAPDRRGEAPGDRREDRVGALRAQRAENARQRSRRPAADDR